MNSKIKSLIRTGNLDLAFCLGQGIGISKESLIAEIIDNEKMEMSDRYLSRKVFDFKLDNVRFYCSTTLWNNSFIFHCGNLKMDEIWDNNLTTQKVIDGCNSFISDNIDLIFS